MAAPITYFKSMTTVRRSRTLATGGELLAKVGDVIASGDAVAHSNLSSRHILLDAAQALNVPPERVRGILQREVGERVEKGAVLAGRRGVGARTLRAPVDGQLAAVSQGNILLQVSDESSRLIARIPGVVSDVEPDQRVVIEFVGSWIQGRWGNGRFADGLLHVIGEEPGHWLTADQIDMGQRGVILAAGRCKESKALELAAEVPVRGLVLGSMPARLLPLARAMEFPLMLIEGFGEMAMNSKAFALLKDRAQEEATLNAQPTDHFEDLRPELLIPAEEAAHPPRPIEVQNFGPGQSVRLLRAPHAGVVGEISNLLPASTLFPSGIRAPAAEIVLSDGSETVAPLANLEILG